MNEYEMTGNEVNGVLIHIPLNCSISIWAHLELTWK